MMFASALAILLSAMGSSGVNDLGSPTEMLHGLQWRNIGPFRGGRVSAVGGSASQPDTFYIGLPQGGVWKTTSSGQTWQPVFDSVKGVSSVGSVAVAPSSPNIVYAGTGEISGGGVGNGIYKTTDAGKTWQYIGLKNSQRIPTLLVDPHNPSVVLAAAMGADVEPTERGVYRTYDGGKSWSEALKPEGGAGVQHLSWAYDNPKVILAATTEAVTFKPLEKVGSPRAVDKTFPPVLYKSTDEGETWTKLAPKGLPTLSGRVCTAIAQGTQSKRMFIIGTFGLYRSDDGGSSWRQTAADDPRIANGQGYYTSGVYVSPKNPDVVYTLATCVYRSTDGGKKFEAFKGAPGGDDPQQMWLNPEDGRHILLGGDQGAVVSLDAGQTWGSWYNQPTAQIYTICVDNQFPYWVYGTQQDSGCIGTSSRGNLGEITPFDWTTHPGNEGGYIAVDPLNPKVSFAIGPVGGIMRVTQPSGQWVQVEPVMSPTTKLRGGSGPFEFSRSNPHELLLATQYLLASTDSGQSWHPLGPDLTLDPDAKTKEEMEQSSQAIVRGFSTSPKSPNILWAATTNGFIKVTKDHGKTWTTVNNGPLSSRRNLNISWVEASATQPETAYVMCRRFDGGRSTYFRTHDFGATWTEFAKNLPADDGDLLHLKSDLRVPNLLYAISQKSALVSFNNGDDWEQINLNLPTTTLSDLQVHGNDLVLATFGRGLWILDDVSPLRQMAGSSDKVATRLFKPADAHRLIRNVNDDTPLPPEVPHAKNPPAGAIVYYSLSEAPKGAVRLEILDSKGNVIRHYSSDPIRPYDDPPPLVPEYWREPKLPLPATVGLNRTNWDGRYDVPPAFNHDLSDMMNAAPAETPDAIEGPLAPPGLYTARLTVDGKTFSETFHWINDPRSPSTQAEIESNHRYRMNLYNAVKQTYRGFELCQELKSKLQPLIDLPATKSMKELKEFLAKLEALTGAVSHVRKFYGPPQPDSFVGLNGYLLARADALNFGDCTPTEAMNETYGFNWQKLKALSDRWDSLIDKELKALNSSLGKVGISPVTAPKERIVLPPPPAKRYLPPPSSNP